MFDPSYTISQISGLSFEHPKEVQGLLDAAASVAATTNTAPSWAGINDPAKAEKVIRQQAQFIAVDGEAFAKAKETAAARIKAALVQAVTEHKDYYLEQRSAVFYAAADQYQEAMSKLPEEFDSEDVLKFTPGVFEAYSQAKSAAADLVSARSWMQTLGEVTGSLRFNSDQWSNDLLILEPTSVAGYATIQLSNRTKEPAHAAVSPELFRAVEAGAGFKLSTGPEATATATRYESERQALSESQWRSVRASLVL